MASTSEAQLNLKLSRSFGKAPDEAPDDFAQCVIDFGKRSNEHLSHQASIATFCYSITMESPLLPLLNQRPPLNQRFLHLPPPPAGAEVVKLQRRLRCLRHPQAQGSRV